MREVNIYLVVNLNSKLSLNWEFARVYESVEIISHLFETQLLSFSVCFLCTWPGCALICVDPYIYIQVCVWFPSGAHETEWFRSAVKDVKRFPFTCKMWEDNNHPPFPAGERALVMHAALTHLTVCCHIQ